MARSMGVLLENFDQHIDSTTLDEFRDHLDTSLRRREKALEKEYKSLSEDDFEDPRDIDGYRMHIEDQAFYAGEVRKLGHELCIVALYRQIEIHTKRVAKRNFPDLNERQLFNIASMKSALPFDLETLPHFAAFDELRLFNNAIKHEGRVSDDLAKKFPTLSIGAELVDLDKVYDRLLPLVQQYTKAFVSNSYKNSAKYKP
ncbi:hypothetical protein AKG95_20495 [Janthinobacterium lividum]|uniref:RiboL-PSP-HEPN domain-containing protein n=1 Tax=Janthinobacterium lividum TaxID=29581 RepID=A0A1S1U6X8_9BURK|nr:hypothetical protein [Janthinobacterium lividum]OHV95524.1 hypothetical protein AKG95_20495 [Janthinobacterium lividum]